MYGLLVFISWITDLMNIFTLAQILCITLLLPDSMGDMIFCLFGVLLVLYHTNEMTRTLY